MSLQPLVELAGVSVHRGATPILRNVDLVIRSGDLIRLLGPNGSGKTTLLRLIATITSPSAGTGTVLGTPLGSATVGTVRPGIGLVGHQTGLRAGLTLGENLRLVAGLAGLRPQAAEAALQQVGLHKARHRRVEHCSNGMLRRADLARLTLGEPSLILLDEAHVGLDTDAVTLVGELTSGVVTRGGAAVVATHDPSRVENATRTLMLVDGSVMERS
ncbi:MAG: ABC transporter ATP-binding protein [Acidimicrobiia bacterium]